MSEAWTAFIATMGWNALEASLLAAVAALVARAFRLGPPARHLLWLLVIVKLVFPPLASHPLGLSGARARAVSTVRSAFGGSGAVESPPGPSSPGPPALPEPGESPAAGAGWLEAPAAPVPSGLESGAPGEAAPELSVGARGPGSPLEPFAEAGDPWPAWHLLLGLIWSAGALAVLVRQSVQTDALQRWIRSARPASDRVLFECRSVSRRIGLRRPPEVKVLDDPVSPMVWTVGRPVVVLPAALERAPGRALLRNVLAHELAHLKRHDHWWSWIEVLGAAAYWWLPTLYWVRGALRRSADQACDARAVAALGSRKTYAESFLSVVELLGAPRLPVPVLGRGLGEREAIERRLTMILRDPLHPRLSLSAFLGVGLLALLALPAAPREALHAQAAAEPAATPDESAPATTPAPPAPSAGNVPQPPVALPAGRGAPHDSERRLQSLEKKMERILEELEALRSDALQPAGSALNTNRGRRRIGAASAATPAPRRAGRASYAGSQGLAPAPEGAPQLPPVPSKPFPPAWPDEPSVAPVAPVAPKAPAVAGVPGWRYRPGEIAVDPTAGLELSAEERRKVEKINRKFEERMEKLRREHREEIREALKDLRGSTPDLDPDEEPGQEPGSGLPAK